MIEVPRVSRCAMRRGLRGDGGAEFGGVGSTDEHQSRSPEPLDQVIVRRCGPFCLFEEGGPGVVGIAGAECMEVLENNWHTTERAIGKRAGGFCPGLLEAFVDDRIELWIQRLGAGDRGINELQRRRLTSADQFGLGGCVEFGEGILVRHAAQAIGRRLPRTQGVRVPIRQVRP